MQFNIPTSYAPQAAAHTSPVATATTPLCPAGNACAPRECGPESKNPGRFFWACQCKPFCKGWIGWVDEPLKGGNARKRPAVEAPAAADDRETRARLDHLEQSLAALVEYVKALEGELKNVQASIYQQ